MIVPETDIGLAIPRFFYLVSLSVVMALSAAFLVMSHDKVCSCMVGATALVALVSILYFGGVLW